MKINSIRLKVIMLVLLMAVPIVLLGIGGTVYYQGIIKQNVWDNELTMAKTISAMTPEYMNTSQLYLKSIADRPLVIKAMEDKDTAFLRSMAAYADETKRINNAYFTDDRGNVIESTPNISSMIGSNVKDRSYVGDVLRTGDPVIGDAEPGYDKMPVVPIGLPIEAENGTILGVMVGTVDLEEYSTMIRQTAVKDQQVVYMVNRTGRIMIHNNPRYMATMENFSSVPSVQNILRGETGVGDYYNPEENESRLSAYATIEPMGWGVVVAMPTSIAYQPVWNATYLFVGGAALLTLAAVVLGLLFGNGLTSPILRLSAATKKIASNSDYTGLLPLERDDELGELARSFRGMVEEIQDKREELENEIMKHREAEKAIKKSQAILAKSQEVAHVCNLALEIKTDRIVWSDEGFRIFGYKPGEVQPSLDLLISRAHPDDRAILQKLISAAISDNKRYGVDIRIVMQDDSIRYVNFVADRLRKDANNAPEWLYGILQDITERKQAEEAKLANAYNRSLIEASLDPLVTIAPDGRITDVNKATEAVTGYPRERLIGTDFSNYFTEPSRASEGYQMVFKEGSVKDYPLEIRHKNGRVTPVLYNASIYRSEAGDVIGVFAAARDVTELKRAEEAIRLANAYNRSLIEASLDPLVTISPDGVITDVNEATEDATGYPRAELIGKDFSDYFTDPGKAREGYQRVFKEGVVMDYPLEIRHRDGHITPVIYNASLYRDEAGKVIGVFAAARDVTELNKAEEELKLKMAEVERSNAELEQFAYVASHDLQEPLRVVASYVKLLDRRYKDRLDADAGEFINYAVEGATRMQQMINDLLAFSRVGTKGKPFEPTDLESIFQRVLVNLSISIRDSNATVTHDQLPSIAADGLQMAQLFQNLVSNGIKFRSIERPPVIHVSAKKLEDSWEFSVRDNGIGIDPEYYDRIFVIFQRLHTKDEYPGSGIGLAICKKIVERHGGRIWVDSSSGEGSTFHFTLPIRQ